MTDTVRLRLFEGFGVEFEYMIVDRETLDVMPICDRLLHDVAGNYEPELEMGDLAWSNELALHVVELKTNGPARTVSAPLADLFQSHVRDINQRLDALNARLMPTAMHPWMDPHQEMRLWPHEFSPVYEAFNRIFDCRGHGWANLQSTHLNLPFADDDEFARLHAAIRLILPILPGLAASSPIVDGRPGRDRDNRLEVYRHNAKRIPLVSARVIPEPVYSQAAYDRDIFQPLYAAIVPLDTDGILQHEWLNARGAIARFDRGAIEIRVLDVQECPHADLAIVSAVTAVLRAMTGERWANLESQQAWPVDALVPILLNAIHEGEDAVVDNADYLRCFGIDAGERMTVGDVWSHLFETTVRTNPTFDRAYEAPLRTILEHGTLATRILAATGQNPERAQLRDVYGALSDCLRDGAMFTGE